MASRSLSRSSVRSGFTLIEALVVIFVIGLLMAILLPAVQATREAARRAQCRSNLRQIGIGLNAYSSLHDTFPPSFGYGVSPFARMLPELEQQPLHSSINFEVATYESKFIPMAENYTARYHQLAVFLCPSDGQEFRGCNYRLNVGVHEPAFCHGPCGPFDSGSNGVPLPRPTSITDGLSRTAFVGERIAGSFDSGSPDPLLDVWLIPGQIPDGIRGSDRRYIPYCLKFGGELFGHTSGRYWYFGAFDQTFYNHNGHPNDPRPSCGETYGLHPPRSFHGSVVQVLLGDGHVESIEQTVEQAIWASLGTHASHD